ncbi:hypothetical protein O6H91_07G036000 [Diphasiastrum complanatum]|uniref:Uncharacterized protein n=1 Tax=Diphasiastrum complanatum TaxID=34168 RepID=A0ACC2D418_DIPCM|nr:hypothetical protein O6H91_07G036000 [Diphasiastrum complanatum]
MSSIRPLSRLVRAGLQKSAESSNLSRSSYGTRVLSRRSFASQSGNKSLKDDELLARARPFWKTEEKWWPYLMMLAASGSLGGLLVVSADAKTKEEGPTEKVSEKKKRLLILGTGWAGVSFLKDLDTSLYEVTIVSPRNYFVFTPLLPNVTSGTVEAHSITEPVRRIARNRKKSIKFYEAECLHIDAANKTASCRDMSDVHVKGKEDFTLEYDLLVIALGAQPNTFGIPGVKEHCHFLKEIEDAERIHQSVLDCFETANLPHLSDEEKRKLLSFVVIGGGPTGVEFAAELHDLIHEDLVKLYPGLEEKVKITVIQGADHILSMFDERISDFAEKKFQRQGVEIQTGCFVQAVTDNEVTVKNKSGQLYTMPYGMAVWSTGIGTRPVVSKFMEQIGQKSRRVLATDEWLRVKGCDNTFALGDCATIEQRKIMEDIDEILKLADVKNSGTLTVKQIKEALESIKERYPQLKAYLKANNKHDVMALLGKKVPDGKNVQSVEVSIEDLKKALGHVDSQLKLFPATAQVAAQQGEYLAKCFNTMDHTDAEKGPPRVRGSGRHRFKPFQYRHLGQFAPLGEEQAAAQLPGDRISIGRSTMWLWYSVYLSKQVSWRTRFLVAFDWSKRVIFGRDSNRM